MTALMLSELEQRIDQLQSVLESKVGDDQDVGECLQLMREAIGKMKGDKPRDVRQLLTNLSLEMVDKPDDVPSGPLEPTEVDVLGPFYVLGSPFRAMLAPMSVVGQQIVIEGYVLDAETAEPLPFTVIDMWQANPENENYDFYWTDDFKKEVIYHPRDDPRIIAGETGAGSKNFEFRTRVLTDHNGHFEVCTVIPPPYFDPDDVCECTTDCLCAWRCPHIHSYVQPVNGMNNTLITQLYFQDMPYNDTDKHFTEKTLIKTEESSRGEATFLKGNFNFVLTK